MSRSARNRLLSVLYNAILIGIVFLAIFPVFFILQAALRPGQALYTTHLTLWPSEITLENFRYMFTEKPLFVWMGNSLKVAGLTTIMAAVLSTSAAYAFSRWKFVGRSMGLALLLAVQAFPGLLSMVAIYQILQGLNLVNTHISLMFVYSAAALVFCTWNMKGYFDTLPNDLEEAAMVDGASPTQAFMHIILPLARPGLVVTAMFSFLSSWNEFAMANVLLTGEKLWTVPLGLFAMQQDYRIPWGYFAAGALINAIPIMLLFLFLQRHLVSGLTLGGIKS